VHDRRDPRRLDAGAAHAVDEAPRLVAARGRHLDDVHAAAGLVEHEQVGEGAADVDADDGARAGRAHRGPPSRSSASRGAT
jgi:hypothetical protein